MSQTTAKKLLYIVLDGWGLTEPYAGNAIALAKKPVFDALWTQYPHAQLDASEEAVGLPVGQIGSSEIGHFTMGAGKVLYQDLVRINKAIKDGSFEHNLVLQKTFDWVKQHGSTLHVIGLLSAGGIHSHETHIHAILDAAKHAGVTQVSVHVITDGRDVMPKSALESIKKLEAKLAELGIGKIATVSGRYFAMDRDHNWDRTDKFMKVAQETTDNQADTAAAIVDESYAANITDEYIEPRQVAPGTLVLKEHDAVLWANFRNDRPRQVTERLLILRDKLDLQLTTMTAYSPEYAVDIIFKLEEVKVTLGQILSEAGIKQLRITETEKFPHMTFFLNCKNEAPYPGEDRLLFDSYKDIKTHDEKPYMRTPEIAQAIVEDMEQEKHQVIFANLCNADMVGHTGNLPAAIEGVETIDAALGKLIPVAQAHGYQVIITADHGNAEEMRDKVTGETLSAHTTNQVPLIVIAPEVKQLNRAHGGLADMAPTVLHLLDLPVPSEMTGVSMCAVTQSPA